MIATLLLISQIEGSSWKNNLETISALKKDVEFLSSSSLEGRKSGEMGGAEAGRWIKKWFHELEMQPLNGNWFHKFPASPLYLTKETALRIGGQLFEAGSDFLPHPSTPKGALTGEIIFAGYGMQIPVIEWDDFEDIDLNKKIALILRWEPQANNPNSLLNGRGLLPQSRLSKKINACQKRGAIAVLVASPPQISQATEAPGKPFWPSHSTIFQKVLPGMAKTIPEEILQKTNFSEEDLQTQVFGMMQNSGPLGATIPVAYISQRVAKAIVKKSGKDIEQWILKADKELANDSFNCHLEAEINIDFAPPSREGRNLIGLVPGTDSLLSNEVVIIGAHYDHVGKNQSGDIWNGADDNASGTAAMLALAKYFSKEKNKTRRTLAFCAFDAEELGLLGASQFLSQGMIDHEKIVAMLNIDMIGRAENNSVSIIGSKSAHGLRQMVEQSSNGIGISLNFNSKDLFDRSDQAPFYFQGIPVLFLTTVNEKEHEDYHTPNDTSEKILYHDLKNIYELGAKITKHFGNEEKFIFNDGYKRRREVYGQPPDSFIPWPIPFHQRMEY